MIYIASIFLAGLITIASAASVQHAPKSHNALVAPGDSTQLVKKINESAYTPECVQAWKIFDASRCWCFTGCALDCSQGGDPGRPGTETNPELCQDLPPKENCLEQTCDLVDKCTGDDATVEVDGALPGIGKLAETGDYDCSDEKNILENVLPSATWIFGEWDPWEGGDSCTTVCNRNGKSCKEELLQLVKSEAAMRVVENQTANFKDKDGKRLECLTYQTYADSDGNLGVPAMPEYVHTSCYIPNAPTYSTCDAANYYRFCPCVD